MAILDLRSKEGKYGGSARAVADLFQNLGKFEQGRRELQVQEAALRSLQETTAAGKQPDEVMAAVNNAAMNAYTNPKIDKGLRGAMQSVFGRFSTPQSPMLSTMAAGALEAIRPLNAVQRVQKAYYEQRAQQEKKIDPNRISAMLNSLTENQQMIRTRYPKYDEKGVKIGYDMGAAERDPDYLENATDIKRLRQQLRKVLPELAGEEELGLAPKPTGTPSPSVPADFKPSDGIPVDTTFPPNGPGYGTGVEAARRVFSNQQPTQVATPASQPRIGGPAAAAASTETPRILGGTGMLAKPPISNTPTTPRMVQMVAPDNTVWELDESEVEEATRNGFRMMR